MNLMRDSQDEVRKGPDRHGQGPQAAGALEVMPPTHLSWYLTAVSHLRGKRPPPSHR